jgi:Fur family transcriptional regulator, peroxide stress response regulator
MLAAVEMNDESLRHMVCSKGKAITDIGEKELGSVSKRDRLPSGFLVERYAVDVIGICAKCQQA